MNETEELLKLSIIYQSLLNDLDELYDDNDRVQEGCHHKLPSNLHQQALQLVSDAVEAACAVKSRAKDLQIDDSDRGWSLTP